MWTSSLLCPSLTPSNSESVRRAILRGPCAFADRGLSLGEGRRPGTTGASGCGARRDRGLCFRAIRGQPAPVVLSTTADQTPVPDGSVCMILLAGGVGKRMGAKIPKQYLELNGRPIATYSLETFSKMKEVGEIVIVCEESWRYVFEDAVKDLGITVPYKWARPGKERQDSVYNGLQEVSTHCKMVGVHDSARPLVRPDDLSRCMIDGWNVGAAVLGVRVTATVKQVAENMDVMKTLDRSTLWAVQTPQMIHTQLLRDGYELVEKEGLEVTDDVSIIEASGKRVVVTQGSYTNIKITTPEDLSTAKTFLDEQARETESIAAAA